jgi:hypothetical protein
MRKLGSQPCCQARPDFETLTDSLVRLLCVWEKCHDDLLKSTAPNPADREQGRQTRIDRGETPGEAMAVVLVSYF